MFSPRVHVTAKKLKLLLSLLDQGTRRRALFPPVIG